MLHEIAQHDSGHANWVCPACLTEVSRKAKSQGKGIHITGHYAEGQCQYIGCSRPSRIEFREPNPFLPDDDETQYTEADLIERPPGYSSLLQLIIGDINT
jgi:hypothetical protein